MELTGESAINILGRVDYNVNDDVQLRHKDLDTAVTLYKNGATLVKNALKRLATEAKKSGNHKDFLSYTEDLGWVEKL